MTKRTVPLSRVRTRKIVAKRSPAHGQWISECLTCGASCLFGSRDSAMHGSAEHRVMCPVRRAAVRVDLKAFTV